MERLTREMTFEEEYIILQKEVKELFDKEDRESEPPESHCVVRRALRCIKKLVSEVEQYKAYNDLEEQGLLLRLPCKVGDTVYAIGFNNNKPIIYESVVLNILITEKEIVFNVKVDEFEINSQLKQSMFGKTVFLTKSEAEAKLKEMRGGENE